MAKEGHASHSKNILLAQAHEIGIALVELQEQVRTQEVRESV